jgi:hypothetical protein
MAPLDFDTREALRRACRGVESVLHALLPAERSADGEAVSDARSDTDCVLTEVLMQLKRVLAEETEPLGPARVACALPSPRAGEC